MPPQGNCTSTQYNQRKPHQAAHTHTHTLARAGDETTIPSRCESGTSKQNYKEDAQLAKESEITTPNNAYTQMKREVPGPGH